MSPGAVCRGSSSYLPDRRRLFAWRERDPLRDDWWIVARICWDRVLVISGRDVSWRSWRSGWSRGRGWKGNFPMHWPTISRRCGSASPSLCSIDPAKSVDRPWWDPLGLVLIWARKWCTPWWVFIAMNRRWTRWSYRRVALSRYSFCFVHRPPLARGGYLRIGLRRWLAWPLHRCRSDPLLLLPPHARSSRLTALQPWWSRPHLPASTCTCCPPDSGSSRWHAGSQPWLWSDSTLPWWGRWSVAGRRGRRWWWCWR